MNILYVIEGYTGFKKLDEDILNSFANVRTYNYKSISNYLDLSIFLDIIWSDIIIIWFASKHAIPTLIFNLILNKPIIIIAGGFDVASLPSIDYGAMRKGSRKKIGNWILSKATNVISVSYSNFREIEKNTNVQKNKIKLIYNAIPRVKKYNSEKKKQVLTVGEINEETFFRKGLDRFISLAEHMLDIDFYHIGKWTNNKGKLDDTFFKYVKSISPKNIKYLGYIKDNDLYNFFKESKVYTQLSRHEAFGVSVVEAVSYNCIPVVWNSFALPEVVPDNGFIIDSLPSAVEKTMLALNLDSYQINKSYLDRFSYESRKKFLKKILLK